MTDNRRPLKSRGTGWATGLARLCARMGLSPDTISALSVVCAGAGFWAFWMSATADDAARAGWLFAAGVAIQLRLLANLLDGMVAVEHGRGGPLGPVWNELPDRIADALFLVGAGMALRVYDPAFGPVLGWTAALLAVLTAYIRELGRALGQAADFAGPGAKPHRMAALTLGCIVAAGLALANVDHSFAALWLALAVIVLLTAATALRRTLRLARWLKATAGSA